MTALMPVPTNRRIHHQQKGHSLPPQPLRHPPVTPVHTTTTESTAFGMAEAARAFGFERALGFVAPRTRGGGRGLRCLCEVLGWPCDSTKRVAGPCLLLGALGGRQGSLASVVVSVA